MNFSEILKEKKTNGIHWALLTDGPIGVHNHADLASSQLENNNNTKIIIKT